MRVFIGQFIKNFDYSEVRGLKKLGDSVEPKDRALALRGIERVNEVFREDRFDLIILDEVIVALRHKLIEKQELLELLKAKPERAELVLTGRNAPPWLIDRADLVTEMREVKHYFEKGVKARFGIEK